MCNDTALAVELLLLLLLQWRYSGTIARNQQPTTAKNAPVQRSRERRLSRQRGLRCDKFLMRFMIATKIFYSSFSFPMESILSESL
jgi:hypothetical protein